MKILLPAILKIKINRSSEITESQIIAAIRDKDAEEIIEFIGRTIRVYTKKDSLGSKPFYWLIEAHDYDDDTLLVAAAFKIYPNIMIANIDRLSPLKLLAAFVEKFGSVLKAGEKRKKFFIKEELIIARDSPQIMCDDFTNSLEYTKCCWDWLTVINDEQLKMEIALAYCIEDAKVRT